MRIEREKERKAQEEQNCKLADWVANMLQVAVSCQKQQRFASEGVLEKLNTP